jgi:hypothetical protein
MMMTVVFGSETWSVLVFERTSLKNVKFEAVLQEYRLVCISLLNLLLILDSLLLVQNIK